MLAHFSTYLGFLEEVELFLSPLGSSLQNQQSSFGSCLTAATALASPICIGENLRQPARTVQRHGRFTQSPFYASTR